MENEKRIELYVFQANTYYCHNLNTVNKAQFISYFKQRNDICFCVWYEYDMWYLQYGHEDKTQMLFNKIYRLQNMDIQLYICPYQECKHAFITYELLDTIKIGRKKENDIVIQNQYVSMDHAVIYQEVNTYFIEDLGSVNKCYVNQKQIRKQRLQRFDKITMIDITIIFMGNFLMIANHPDIHNISLAMFYAPYQKKQAYTQRQIVNAMPFYYPKLEQLVFYIEEPQRVQTKQTMPIWYMLGPSMTMGLSSTMMMLYSFYNLTQKKMDITQSIPSLIMSFSMVISTLLWPVLTQGYDRRRMKKEHIAYTKTYLAYVREQQNAIYLLCDNISKQRIKMLESSEKAFTYLKHPSLLYHRRVCEEAWLYIYIGIGNLDANVKFNEITISSIHREHELIKEMEKVLNTNYQLSNTAIGIALQEEKALGIVCEDIDKRICCMLTILAQIVLLHTYEELQIILIMPQQYIRKSGVVWIPHIMHQNYRLLVSDKYSAKQIQRILSQADFKEKSILIVNMEYRLEQQIPNIQSLLNRDNCYYLQSVEYKETLRNICQNIVYVNEDTVYITSNRTRIPLVMECWDVNQLYKTFSQLTRFQFSHHKAESFQTILTLQDLYQSASIKQLQIEKRWQQHQNNTLQIMIGIDEQGAPIVLDAHEREHGPHGLIAGTTGSGKSECILTLIMSLAICYPCHQVSFFLIDYKGGMSAKAVEKLPHVANILTNLDENALIRSMLGLKHEVRKRQQILVEWAEKLELSSLSIDEYQTLFKEHKVKIALPHLFIIIDEFAELKMQHSEFMDQLKQIARIGRSLGIHLILCTQKPAGIVDDQIWSNARFRICLKVGSREDSIDVLKHDDALYLQQAGDFYLQVGNDEIYQKGHTAWTQAPYCETQFYERPHDTTMCIMDQTLHTIGKQQVKLDTKAIRSQLQETIHEIIHLSKKYHHEKIQIINHPLLENIVLYGASKCIGWMDDVHQQHQYPMVWNVKHFSVSFVCGIKHSGKQMFLETLLLTYATLNDTYIYVFDGYMKSFMYFYDEQIIDDLVYPQDEEKIIRFFKMVEKEIQIGNKSKRFLFIFHDFTRFQERYDFFEGKLLSIIRDGIHLNIQIVITSEKPHAISIRLQNVITHMYLLQLKNKHDYQTFFHTSEIFPLHQKGSGITLDQDNVVQFQIGQFEMAEKEKIMSTYKRQESLQRIPILPKRISIEKDKIDCLFLGKAVQSL